MLDQLDSPRGALLVWTDIPTADELAFNEWYNRRHVPDRIHRVPGFIMGARYIGQEGVHPKYLAYYETSSPEVLSSQAYLNLQRDRDPETNEILLKFCNTIRVVGRVSLHSGESPAAFLSVLPITPAKGCETALRTRLQSKLLPQLLKSESVTKCVLIERDNTTLQASSKVHVRKTDRTLDWVLMFESSNELTARHSIITAHLGLINELQTKACTLSVFRLLSYLSN